MICLSDWVTGWSLVKCACASVTQGCSGVPWLFWIRIPISFLLACRKPSKISLHSGWCWFVRAASIIKKIGVSLVLWVSRFLFIQTLNLDPYDCKIVSELCCDYNHVIWPPVRACFALLLHLFSPRLLKQSLQQARCAVGSCSPRPRIKGVVFCNLERGDISCLESVYALSWL